MGLADPAVHTVLLDAYGVAPELRSATGAAWRRWRDAEAALEAARATLAEAQREEDWLRHAVGELTELAPEQGDEDRLAAERQRLQHHERRAEAIAVALAEIAPRDRRSPGPAATLRAASRALQRLGEDPNARPALAALDRAEEALAEAETLLSRLATEAEADPRVLEQAEERLFALRAASRKHGVPVAELAALLDGLQARLAALDTGTAEIAALEARAAAARSGYGGASGALTRARVAAAERLQLAVTAELPPLRLDKSRFVVELRALDEPRWGANGADRVAFLIATNPGQMPGPLDRIASGGELSRLMLALKVVLVAGGSVPTLVFDEVDSGIGGAVAAAVGRLLQTLATRRQVLCVTHLPQVAAFADAHFRVTKADGKDGAVSDLEKLAQADRVEEIARMLGGAAVTAKTRAHAKELFEQHRRPR
jgi:DNA repair protein RecN (Recombination protein N)